MISYIKIIILVTSLIVNIQGGSKMDTTLHNVSMVQLIANPQMYDNKYVIIIGFVSLKFESKAVYLSSLDFEHSINKNGLWLSLEKYNIDSGQYCIIEGVFNANKKGHLGMYSGSIEKITRLDVWK